MSSESDAELDSFLNRDHWLPHMTAEAVGDALLGFPLESERPLGWIAMAARRALSVTVRNATEGPERKPAKDVRDELTDLGARLGQIWVDCESRSQEADGRVWDYSFQNWEGVNALAAAEDPNFAFNRFSAALRELDWLAGFLRRAGQSTEVPRGNWVAVEQKRLRIDRGHCLAPVFEATFQEPAQANNWPSDARHSKTHFMDFYQRMTGLAFGDSSNTNLSDILKAACRMHRRDPVVFEDSFIPGLGGAAT